MMGLLRSSSAMILLCLCIVGVMCVKCSDGATVVVDGVTQWRDPSANFGDTIVFRHKYHYSLYIFRSRLAFDVCNFTQASLLSSPNSMSYTWHPSRPGYFYFSFYNGTNIPCQDGQKLAIKVTPPASPPQYPTNPPTLPPVMAAPPPISGGIVSSSPAYPWPFQPREKSGWSPTLGPTGSSSSASAASPAPEDKGGSSIPFINSNPAVPLPSGEVDSATILPLPTTASHAPSQELQLVGLVVVLVPLYYAIFLLQ
ncbi:hypothetical protein Ancab_038554 [Ancistrocladus abbreviatus]